MKQSQYEANRRYLQANYENITLSVPKGTRQKYKELASARGLSLCEFIRRAVFHYCSCTLINDDGGRSDDL